MNVNRLIIDNIKLYFMFVFTIHIILIDDYIYYSKTVPIIPRGTINEDEGQSSAISLFWLGYKSFLLLRYRNHCFLIFLIGLSDSLYELYLESRLIIDY